VVVGHGDWECFWLFWRLEKTLMIVSGSLVHSVSGRWQLGVFLAVKGTGRDFVFHEWVSGSLKLGPFWAFLRLIRTLSSVSGSLVH
jgi:hypothetical protein